MFALEGRKIDLLLLDGYGLVASLFLGLPRSYLALLVATLQTHAVSVSGAIGFVLDNISAADRNLISRVQFLGNLADAGSGHHYLFALRCLLFLHYTLW